MDANYITPLIRSVDKVFATMLQLHVTMGEPKVQAAGDSKLDVSSIIGLSGDLIGAIVLSFESETAERLVALFAGAPLKTDDPDFADAVGELVNMVAGNAKADYTGKNISISCPSVVVGPGHRVFQQNHQPIIEIPCECECGTFTVLVTLRENAEAGAQTEAA